MTRRLVRPALRAILEAIEGMEAATEEKTLEDYEHDWLLRHGLQRGLEIISEAARRIPPDLRGTRPEIPWAEIIGRRRPFARSRPTPARTNDPGRPR